MNNNEGRGPNIEGAIGRNITMASSSRTPSQNDFQELHRHSSFSSTDQDRSLEHSPLDSPNGINVSHVSGEFPSKLMKSNSMEFNFQDEDESDGNISGEPPPDQKLSKKDIHSLNEQRRRDLIKQGYSQLLDLVPTCKPSSAGSKPSRAVILQRNYILYLHNQSVKQQNQVEELEKEVKALKIMKENYEQIARAQRTSSSSSSQQLPDHVKFLVFQGISDQLFHSFNSCINVTSFDTLSSCIISWLEEHCKPQTLKDIVLANMRLDKFTADANVQYRRTN